MVRWFLVNRRRPRQTDKCVSARCLAPSPVGGVSNRGPRPLLGRGVPTRYWEGTLDRRKKGVELNNFLKLNDLIAEIRNIVQVG